MSITTMLFVPTILFMVVVAPIWLTMHYRSKDKTAKGISPEERENLDDMLATMDKLMDRIETLESILNDTHSEWRNSQNAAQGSRGNRASGARSAGENIDG